LIEYLDAGGPVDPGRRSRCCCDQPRPWPGPHARSVTVRNHISNIMTKLHVFDWVQAIIRARAAGLK
jgi:hypothetical protein